MLRLREPVLKFLPYAIEQIHPLGLTFTPAVEAGTNLLNHWRQLRLRLWVLQIVMTSLFCRKGHEAKIHHYRSQHHRDFYGRFEPKSTCRATGVNSFRAFLLLGKKATSPNDRFSAPLRRRLLSTARQSGLPPKVMSKIVVEPERATLPRILPLATASTKAAFTEQAEYFLLCIERAIRRDEPF